jgi:hypothetical protein
VSQEGLWILGLALCVAGAVGFFLGLAAERSALRIAGIVAFFVLWYAGFFCFVGAS